MITLRGLSALLRATDEGVLADHIDAAAEDIRQRELRRRALFDYAADLDLQAAQLPAHSADALELRRDANAARAAARALDESAAA